MPQDFSRDVGAGIAFEQPVQAPRPAASGLEVFAELATNLVRTLPRQTAQRQPDNDRFVLDYRTNLESAHQAYRSGNITQSEYNRRLNNADLEILQQDPSINLGAQAYEDTRVAVTGMSRQNFARTENERILEQADPGDIIYARQRLRDQNAEINSENLALVLNEVNMIQEDTDRIKAQTNYINANSDFNDANVRRDATAAATVFTRDLYQSAENTTSQLRYLAENNIQIPAETGSASAIEARREIDEMRSSFPSNTPAELIAGFEAAAEQLENTYKSLGFMDENGIPVTDPAALAQINLNNRITAIAMVVEDLETGEVPRELSNAIVQLNLLKSADRMEAGAVAAALSTVNSLITTHNLWDRVEDYIFDPNTLSENTISGLYSQTIIDTMGPTAQSDRAISQVISSLPPELQERYGNMNLEQAAATVRLFYTTANELDFDLENNFDGAVNNILGFTIALSNVDSRENAFSPEFLQRSLSQMPDRIRQISEIDPVTGANLQAAFFEAVSNTRFDYSQQIRNAEQRLSLGGYTRQGESYILSGLPSAADPRFAEAVAIQELYDGNLTVAVEDNFRRIEQRWRGVGQVALETPNEQEIYNPLAGLGRTDIAYDSTGRPISEVDPTIQGEVTGLAMANTLRERYPPEEILRMSDLRVAVATLDRVGAEAEPTEHRSLMEDRFRNAMADNLPSTAVTRTVGTAEIFVDSGMNPAFEIQTGVTHSSIEPWVVENARATLEGPFRELQRLVGPLEINDMLPKVGTSRDDPNYAEGTGSQHFYGHAIDVDISNMTEAQRLRLLQGALQAGFRGIGLGRDIFHMDLRDTYTPWTYDTTGETWGGLDVDVVQQMIREYGGGVASFSRPFNLRNGAGSVEPDIDRDTEGATSSTLLSLDRDTGTPAVTTAPQPVGEVTVDTVSAEIPTEPAPEQPAVMAGQVTPEQTPQETPQTSEEVRQLVEETTGQERVFTSVDEATAAIASGEVTEGETITVQDSEGTKRFRVGQGSSIERVE